MIRGYGRGFEARLEMVFLGHRLEISQNGRDALISAILY
jgi:hypothetical protein